MGFHQSDLEIEVQVQVLYLKDIRDTTGGVGKEMRNWRVATVVLLSQFSQQAIQV